MKDAAGLFHYGTSNRLSRYSMALDVCKIMRFSEELIKPVNFSDLDIKAKRPLQSGFITDKVHKILNMPSISFTNALIRMTET